MSHRFLFPAILILGLAACDNRSDNTPAATASADNAPAQHAAADSVGKSPSAPTGTNANTDTAIAADAAAASDTATTANAPISAQDVANLSRAMHGAAEQQSEDTPKDQYGKPYIIGDLGGVPVNLPRNSVHYLEYADSPGFNREALKAFKPPMRDYDSVIKSFGFEFRDRDKQILDRRNSALVKEREEELKATRSTDDDWHRVSISAQSATFNPNFLDDSVADYYQKIPDTESPIFSYWAPNGEYFHGLQVNIHPGIDPKTGKPWREDSKAEDIFIYRDAEGRVQSIIRCTNQTPVQTCGHRFKFPDEMGILIKLFYTRGNLPEWRELEQTAIELVLNFRRDQQ